MKYTYRQIKMCVINNYLHEKVINQKIILFQNDI